MRILKRYSNRRIYDARTRSSLTHAQLAELIRRGERIQVIDSRSGEDITADILGRVALHESTGEKIEGKKALFTSIIELTGDKPMSILKNTVLASIGAFQVTKSKAEKIIDELIKKGDLNKSDRKKAVMELLEKAEKSTADFRNKVSGEAVKAQKEVTRMAKEVRSYKLVKQQDIKKLENKVDKLTRLVTKLEKALKEKK